MYQTQEQLIAASRAQLETAMRLTEVALRGFEQVIGLQLNAAKNALAEGTTGVRALTAAKDAKEMADVQQRFIKPNLDKAQAYALEMYGVATHLRQELDDVVSRQVAEFNKSLVAALDQAAKSTPNGTDYAVTAMRSAVMNANAAVDSIKKLGKQMAAAADANVATLMQANAAGKKKAA